MPTQTDACSPIVIDLVLSITRGSVLLICAFAGVLSIYLGWRLYREAVVSKTSGLLEFKGLRFRLIAAGPGVFLVAFGAWLLVHLVDHPLEMSDPVASHRSSFDGKQSDPQAFLRIASPLIAVTDVTTKKQPPPECIVPVRIRRLYGGGDELSLTRSSVHEALAIAIAAVKAPASSEARASMNEDERQRKDKVLAILTLMLDESSRK